MIHPELRNPPSTPTPSQPIQEDGSPAPPNQTIPKDSFGIREVIKGFYGTPWTTEQRINMLSFMGQNHMNTYVYAPKDDPYQRAYWGELYHPDGLLLQMKSLVQTAAAQGITFVYSISPGIPSLLPGETLTKIVSISINSASIPAETNCLTATTTNLPTYQGLFGRNIILESMDLPNQP